MVDKVLIGKILIGWVVSAIVGGTLSGLIYWLIHRKDIEKTRKEITTLEKYLSGDWVSYPYVIDEINEFLKED